MRAKIYYPGMEFELPKDVARPLDNKCTYLKDKEVRIKQSNERQKHRQDGE